MLRRSRHILGGRYPVLAQRQQRRTSHGLAAILRQPLAQYPPRAVLRIEPVTGGRIDRLAVTVVLQIEAEPQPVEHVALELPQSPCQRGTGSQVRTRLRIAVEQLRHRRMARCKPQQQFADIETRQHRFAKQPRRGIDGLGLAQLRQLAALHRGELDQLQRLQRSAQRLLAWPVHAPRQQSHAPVLLGQHFHQQAGLAPGACVQDKAALVFDQHDSVFGQVLAWQQLTAARRDSEIADASRVN